MRQRAGEALGGRVVGDGAMARVQGVTCPACKLPSVWWPIAPRLRVKAMCHHRRSCGWMGFIDELLDAATVAA